MCAHIKVLFFLFATSAFAQLALGGEISFSFEYPVEVATPSREGLVNQKVFAPGERVILPMEKPYWVQSQGRIPVILIPVTSSIEEIIKLNLPEVGAWPPRAVEKEIDYKMSMMIDLMTQFQAAIIKRDVRTAETLLNQMTSIQNVASLNFLRASLQFIKGDLDQAKLSVRKGLERFPANSHGIQLLRSLEGAGK